MLFYSNYQNNLTSRSKPTRPRNSLHFLATNCIELHFIAIYSVQWVSRPGKPTRKSVFINPFKLFISLSSRILTSWENRAISLPVGVTSKKFIGPRSIFNNSMLWSDTDALKPAIHMRKIDEYKASAKEREGFRSLLRFCDKNNEE